VVATLRSPANKAFEISAFREVEGRRMVGTLSEDPHDLRFTPGIKGCIGHDLLKEVKGNQSGTRKGEKNATWSKKLESEEINVLIAAGSLEQLASGLHKFRGVQNNEVKAPVKVSEFAQNLKDIPFHMINLSRIKPIDLHIAHAELNGARRGLHVCHMLCSASQCPDPESAGVRKAVEDQTSFDIVRKSLPIFPLIQVKTCFVTLPDVHKEATRSLFNEQEIRR
jgi:hypothetical protein